VERITTHDIIKYTIVFISSCFRFYPSPGIVTSYKLLMLAVQCEVCLTPTLVLIAADTSLRFHNYSNNNIATLQTTTMVKCAVATCSTRSGQDEDVCMFRFPKDPKLKQTWFIKCRRENYIVNEHARVSKKYCRFWFRRTFAASLGYNRTFRLIKPDAVLTILPEPKSKTPSLTKRKLPRTSMALEKRRCLEVKYFTSVDDIC